MTFPVVFVSFDMKFYKVFSIDVNVHPFKEIMAFTDNIYVADDTIYFTTTMNHILLVAVFCSARIPYIGLTLTSDQVLTVMSNRVQFTPTIRDYCVNDVSIALFHATFKLYDVCLKTEQLQSLVQAHQQAIRSSNSDVPKEREEQVAENSHDDIDQLIEEWEKAEPYSDAIDKYLDKLLFEDIPLTDDVQDMDGIVSFA